MHAALCNHSLARPRAPALVGPVCYNGLGEVCKLNRAFRSAAISARGNLPFCFSIFKIDTTPSVFAN